MKQKILVLCTGNSCRSQIAEGYIKFMAGDRFDVFSAGLEPSIVNPNAIEVMKEDSVDISYYISKAVNLFLGQHFDFIITVCDYAKELCPFFPVHAKRIQWSFEDPAAVRGTKEEILLVFRKIRDQIKTKIDKFISEEV